MAAEKINENNFDFILENYKLEKQHGEFDGNWDPYSVKSVDELKDKIKISGDTFWGDHIIIQLLEESLNINIIILNCENDFFLKRPSKSNQLDLQLRHNKKNYYYIILSK